MGACGRILFVAVLLAGGGAFAPKASGQSPRLAKIEAKAHQALAQKNYALAKSLLAEALRIAPRKKDLREGMTEVCLQLGLRFHSAGKMRRAFDQFRQATIWSPKDTRTWLALAEVAQGLGNQRQAEYAWKRSLSINPGEFDALYSLGKLYYERRSYDKAAIYLGRAKQVNPKDPRPKRLLEKTGQDRGIERFFSLKKSSHFAFHFRETNGGGERRAKQILNYLEQAHGELVRFFGRDPRKTMVVMAYNTNEFAMLKHPASWTVAYYDGKIRVPIDGWTKNKRDASKVLKHELTHAFLDCFIEDATPWMHEGLAQLNEERPLGPNLAVLKQTGIFGPHQLRSSFVQIKDENMVKVLYAESLILLDYLQKKKGINGLRGMIQMLQKGKQPIAQREDLALKKIYGKDLDGLLTEMRSVYKIPIPSQPGK